MMCNCEGHILRAYVYHVFLISENILWKGHCMCKRVHFWHRSRLRHDLLQWDALQFLKKFACWREHSLQRDASLLFKGTLKLFEHVLTQGFEPTMSIWKSVLHIHWLPTFLHLFNTVFEKLHKQTKLPNLCPKPPKVPPVILAFCLVFFLHGFLMEPQAQSNQ